MSQSAAAPAGVAAVGSTVTSPSGTYDVMQGGPSVPVDGGGMSAVMRGMQNMLGKTPEERETNAKALSAAVRDINGLVGTMSETTLLQRMMEAQGSGMGFVEGSPGSAAGAEIPRSFTPSSASPIVSQLGFR